MGRKVLGSSGKEVSTEAERFSTCYITVFV